MREIKFRFYDRFYKQMIYSDDMAFGNLSSFFEEFEDRKENDNEPELMYGSGLISCCEKQIYEGDIMSNNYGLKAGIKEVLRQVEYVGAEWSMIRIKGKSNFDHILQLHSYYLHNYKVIGNIYENPELLK